MRRLEGRTAIVTGAAVGIGAATARRMADEGARVVLADINIEGAERVCAEITAGGADVTALRLDLADDDSIRQLIAATVERYGRLDILFNNAADTRLEIMQGDGPIELMDAAIWDRVFHVNARGTMLMIKEALPALIASGNASIINTSSGSSLLGDLFRPAYAGTKAAINILTRYVAAQYGKKGVRCNAVLPGLVVTESTSEGQAENMAMYERHHLTPYLGRPADIAAVVAMLASDAGRFVNGANLVVDGGISSHFAHVADNRPAFEAHVEALR